MTKNIKGIMTILLFCVIGAGFLLPYGCQKGQPNRESISIGLAREPLNGLTIIAIEKGFFYQEDLDVKVVEYPSGKRALVDGLLSGQVDVATVSEVPIVFNSFNRSDFSVVATAGSSDNEPRIIARKSSGIQKPADLEGKRLATQRASAVHFFLHLFMVKHGLSQDAVNLSFKKAEELPHALANGKIDAFSMREPFISKAKDLLKEDAIIFSEPGLYSKTFNLVVNNSVVLQRPAVIEQMLRALMQAEIFTANYPYQAMEIVANRLGINKKQMIDIWPEIRLKISLDQSLVYSLKDEARWAIDENLTDKHKIPNYFSLIYVNGLRAVKPQAVTIIY